MFMDIFMSVYVLHNNGSPSTPEQQITQQTQGGDKWFYYMYQGSSEAERLHVTLPVLIKLCYLMICSSLMGLLLQYSINHLCLHALNGKYFTTAYVWEYAKYHRLASQIHPQLTDNDE